VARQGPARKIEIQWRLPTQDQFMGSDCTHSRHAKANAASPFQDLGFAASLAADITSPVIWRMCSPALVNWLRRNSDWICMAC